MTNPVAFFQFLQNLTDNHEYDLGFAEQGCYNDSVVLRSGCERYELVLRIEDETWTLSYTSGDEDKAATVKSQCEWDISEYDAAVEACENLEEVS